MLDVCKLGVSGLCRTNLGVARRTLQICCRALVVFALTTIAVGFNQARADAPPKGTVSAGSSNAATQSQPASGSVEDGDQKKLMIPTDTASVIEIMGPWMVPYIIASVIFVWFTLERLVVLRRGRVIPKRFVKEFLENLKGGKLDQATAIGLCEKNDSPIAQLFICGLRKWGRPGIEVEQAIIDGGERQVSKLRKHVRALNTISVIMPMVGLFGTVVGMVQSFNELAIAASTGNNALLAAGISVALLTTAFGLAIAIPALTTYIYFMGRVEALVLEMDEFANEVAYFASAEYLQSVTVTAPRTKPTRSVAEKSVAVPAAVES